MEYKIQGHRNDVLFILFLFKFIVKLV